MDNRRFDALARGLAMASNRRQVLKGLLGIGGAITATSIESAQAARRPSPTPRPVTCPGEQTWKNSQCVCPDGKVKCGPDCCAPGVSECCDNACCFGECYGEELCCPTGSIACNGQCQDWECCTDLDCPGTEICDGDTHMCQCVPNCADRTCGDDGCDAVCGTCPEGQVCFEGGCVCATGTRFCEGQCRDWQCCTDLDCPESETCDSETHSCQCAPDCDGKTCGPDGCGGTCGECGAQQTCSNGNCVCPSGLFLCADGACRQCCEAADCGVFFPGGDEECWRCFQNTCGYFSGFCDGDTGVCGVSSAAVWGHCEECGVVGATSSDACSAAVPCCTGFECDFRYGDQGICRLPA